MLTALDDPHVLFFKANGVNGGYSGKQVALKWIRCRAVLYRTHRCEDPCSAETHKIVCLCVMNGARGKGQAVRDARALVTHMQLS